MERLIQGVGIAILVGIGLAYLALATVVVVGTCRLLGINI